MLRLHRFDFLRVTARWSWLRWDSAVRSSRTESDRFDLAISVTPRSA